MFQLGRLPSKITRSFRFRKLKASQHAVSISGRTISKPLAPKVWRLLTALVGGSFAISCFASAEEGEERPNQKEVPIVRVVLTGGPCGGKSTALAHIMEHMRSLGWRVYTVPEAATLLLGGGCGLGDTPEKFYAFENHLMHVQQALESHFIDIARSAGEPSVIIMDRGAMDIKAYMTPEMWQLLLDENKWNAVHLRDGRYDAVIHLVTAARGAEKFYTTANNTVRSETPEQARLLDDKLLDAWVGHPKLRVIDNTDTFKEKVRRVNEAVCQIAGVPAPKKSERRFLIQAPDFSQLPSHVEKFKVDLKFLESDGASGRLKKREQGGVSSYTYSSFAKQETWERIVTSREYLSLSKQVDSTKKPVQKEQFCFLHNSQAWTINHYTSPKEAWVLETHTDGDSMPVVVPPFLKVEREVTGGSEYTAKGLAFE